MDGRTDGEGWLIFAGVILMVAGVMRFRSHPSDHGIVRHPGMCSAAAVDNHPLRGDNG
jgi:hypothetical protein